MATKRKLGEVVAGRIKQLIVDQGLKPGDRLPTEQELAERFGVSRLSVREATTTLNFLGIINSAPRRGLTVGEFDLNRIGEILGFHYALAQYPSRQLVQARLVIEVGALPFASERLSQDEILYQHLLELARRTEQDCSAEEFIDREIAYHRALVETSGIEPLVMFADILHAFFRRFFAAVVAHRRDPGVYQHRRLVELLRARQLAEAESTLRSHLQTFLEMESEDRR